MEDIQLIMGTGDRGAFELTEGGQKTGEMDVSIRDGELIVYHTEVKTEGKGDAKKLLAAMTAYARENGMKVRPLCPYVHAQFERQAPAFDDIWEKE